MIFVCLYVRGYLLSSTTIRKKKVSKRIERKDEGGEKRERVMKECSEEREVNYLIDARREGSTSFILHDPSS